MKARHQLAMANTVADIRRLQLERGQLDALRLQSVLSQARQRETVAAMAWQSLVHDWQRATEDSAGLSSALAVNWSHALASERHRWRHATEATRKAAQDVSHHREQLARQQCQADHADAQRVQAKRRHQKKHDERHSRAIEEWFTARERAP